MQVAWIATGAATSASQTAATAVNELQTQLDFLQAEVSQITRSQMPEQQTAAATTAAAATRPGVAIEPNSPMSFSDLAAPSPAAAALTRQLLSAAASESATHADQSSREPSASDRAAASSTAEENWFEHAFDDSVGNKQASSPPDSGQPTPAAASEEKHEQDVSSSALVEGAFGSIVETAFGSVADRADSVTDSSVIRDSSTQELLAAQLALMTPAHQVKFLAKLSNVVSSHAARLLATYHSDPELSKQLKQVQQQLSELSSAGGAAARSNDSLAAFARSSSSRQLQSVNSTAPASAAAGSAEVLLGILDQVASLRAIGSATHPAISEALQKHEQQIARIVDALSQLQEQQQHAGGSRIASTADLASTTAAVTDNSDTEAKAVVSFTASRGPAAAAEASDPAPASAAAVAESYEGEWNQRLSAVEIRLSAGLKVLAGLRDKMAPIQEVSSDCCQPHSTFLC